MPPGRPSKRTGQSADGNSSDEPSSSSKLKPQRTHRGSAQHDFSSVVKSKLQSYTRTGQACDRCKVRKIRCDALPEGCSHCISQNLECYVTDRVTGRTERRGYTQELEREKAAMLAQIRTLERMLESNGIQTTRFQWPPQSFDSPRRSSSRSNFDASSQDHPHQQPQLPTPIPPSSPFSTSENVSVNVSSGNHTTRTPLVSYSGLCLSILGSNVDLGVSDDTDPRDVPLRPMHAPSDYSLAEKSMLHMLRNLQQPEAAELPPWNDAVQYTEWYFANIYQFFPLLHKPTFFASLRNLYDNPDSPSIEPAQLVTIHTVFAITLRQIGSTSPDHSKRPQMHTWSDKHYLLALGKFSELSALRNLQDCQAMAHLLFHSMRYSKPRFSVLISNEALALAMELNLHRATPSPTSTPGLENEMRKRLWWSILWLSIIVLGRLGRPMPLGLHEMDVEYPEAISDEMLEHSGGEASSTEDCPFLVAIWIMRATKMYLYMLSTMYGVNTKPSSYLASLRTIEQQFKRWQESLPESLRVSESDFADPKGKASHNALYIHYIGLHFQLYFRHPMAVPCDDPGLLESALYASEENSKALLKCRLALRKLRSTEGTWLALGTYTTAAFLHLASCWQRRRDLSNADHTELRRDMGSWLTIINDTSQLLENGQRLPNAINDVIHRTLVWIEQDHRGSGSESSTSHSTQDMLNDAPHNTGYMSSISSMMPNHAMVDSRGRSAAPYALPSRPGFYPDPSVYGQPMGYSNTHMHAQSSTDYNSPNHFIYEGQMRLDHPMDQTHSGPIQRSGSTINAYASSPSTMQQQPAQHRMWRPHSSAPDGPELSTGIGPSGSGATSSDSTWHEWNTAMAGSQENRYGSNALMNMGQQTATQQSEGRISTQNDMNLGIVPDVPVQSENLAWPGMLYPGGSGRNPGT